MLHSYLLSFELHFLQLVLQEVEVVEVVLLLSVQEVVLSVPVVVVLLLLLP